MNVCFLTKKKEQKINSKEQQKFHIIKRVSQKYKNMHTATNTHMGRKFMIFCAVIILSWASSKYRSIFRFQLFMYTRVNTFNAHLIKWKITTASKNIYYYLLCIKIYVIKKLFLLYFCGSLIHSFRSLFVMVDGHIEAYSWNKIKTFKLLNYAACAG
jgi:hypothetical protein